MKPYVQALELVAEGNLPRRIDGVSQPAAALIEELMGAGYITAIDASSHDGSAYLNPRILWPGASILSA